MYELLALQHVLDTLQGIGEYLTLDPDLFLSCWQSLTTHKRVTIRNTYQDQLTNLYYTLSSNGQTIIRTVLMTQ